MNKLLQEYIDRVMGILSGELQSKHTRRLVYSRIAGYMDSLWDQNGIDCAEYDELMYKLVEFVAYTGGVHHG